MRIETPAEWGGPVQGLRILFKGDSKLVVHWMSGELTPNQPRVIQYVAPMQEVMVNAL